MLAFSFIAVQILLLIYFVMRMQTAQKDLVVSRSTLKNTSRRVDDALRGLHKIAKEMEHVYLSRLERANTKGLISSAKYPVLFGIFTCFSKVMVDCYENGLSVENALTKAIQSTEISMEEIREMIKEEPNDIRVAWVQNTPDSFMSACNQLSSSWLQ